MRFTLLTLVLFTPNVLSADDPPYLAAAKGRQRAAQAFEVALTARTEWKNVKAFRSEERRDFADTGTAKLVVDGDKFWCAVDVPAQTGDRSRLTRRRTEQAFDGGTVFARTEHLILTGERAGQFHPTNSFETTDTPPAWESLFDPLRWAFRATGRGGLLSTGEPPLSLHWPQTIQASGREEVIGGKRCVEVVHTTSGWHGEFKESFWFDVEAGHVPKRVRRTAIDFTPHPVVGWRPSGWTSTGSEGEDSETRTTVTVDSFEVREAILAERFVIRFPVGSRVVRNFPNATHNLIVAADGSLRLVTDQSAAEPTPPAPELPSAGRTLAVIGITLAVFAGFVLLLRRLARVRSVEPPPGDD